jgi:hypothetical protein
MGYEVWGFLVFVGFAIIAILCGFVWIAGNPVDNTVSCGWNPDKQKIRDRLFVELMLLVMFAVFILFATTRIRL